MKLGKRLTEVTVRTRSDFEKFINGVLRDIERNGNKMARDVQKELQDFMRDASRNGATLTKSTIETANRKISKIVNRDAHLGYAEAIVDLLDSNPKETSQVYDQLEALWQNFKSAHNRAMSEMNQKGNNIFLTDNRKDEFYAYVLAGKFGSFNPFDVNPAYAGGDIFATDEQGKSTHVQLKGEGGYFKMAFSYKFLLQNEQRLLADYYNEFVSGAMDGEASFSKTIGQYVIKGELDQTRLANLLQKEPKLKNSTTIKKIIMKAYISVTKGSSHWYMFSMQSTAGGADPNKSGLGFSFSVPSNKMVEFVGIHPELFRVSTERIKATKKTPARTEIFLFFQPKFSGNQDPRYWKLGIDKTLPVFLHNGIPLQFYKVRNAYDKTGDIFTKEYNDEVVKIGGITSKAFLDVHEATFGALNIR